MKQRYKEKVGYLFKRKQYIKGDDKPYTDTTSHEVEGLAFYCNVREKSRRIEVPMSSTYRTVTETVILTSSQLNFEEHDRISFTPTPRNDVNQQDYNTIVSAIQKPVLMKGSKYRNQDYYEWELRVS
jgi:hypothetical protein